MQDVPTCEIKSRIAIARKAFDKKKALSTSTLDINLRNKLVKSYVWSIALCGTGTRTLQKVGQKHLRSF